MPKSVYAASARGSIKKGTGNNTKRKSDDEEDEDSSASVEHRMLAKILLGQEVKVSCSSNHAPLALEYMKELGELCDHLIYGDKSRIKEARVLIMNNPDLSLLTNKRTKLEKALDDGPFFDPSVKTFGGVSHVFLWGIFLKKADEAKQSLTKEMLDALSKKSDKKIKNIYTYFTGFNMTDELPEAMKEKAVFVSVSIAAMDSRGDLINRGGGFFTEAVNDDQVNFTGVHGCFNLVPTSAENNKVASVKYQIGDGRNADLSMFKSQLDASEAVGDNYSDTLAYVMVLGEKKKVSKFFKGDNKIQKVDAETMKMYVMKGTQSTQAVVAANSIEITADMAQASKRKRSRPTDTPTD